SIEAKRQVSPIVRARRTIAAACLISSADSGSSGCELVTRSSWLMAGYLAKILVLAAPAAQAIRFGHAQCGSDDGVDDQVSARLRGEPAAAGPGPAGPGLHGPGRARRGAEGPAWPRAAHARPGTRGVRLGNGARGDLGGQPALPRLHPGRPDQGLAAVR